MSEVVSQRRREGGRRPLGAVAHDRSPQRARKARLARGRRLSEVVFCLLMAAGRFAGAAEVVVDFEQAVVGKPVTSWTEQDVVFTLAREPTQSKAPGRVMFFPHLATQHKGILCAMATEPIPVQAKFPRGATSVTLVLWASTGCAAVLEACDQAGNVIDRASLPVVPGRTAPGDPVPLFELSVRGPAIAFVRFSGPRPGEFLAADEVRFTPLPEPAG